MSVSTNVSGNGTIPAENECPRRTKNLPPTKSPVTSAATKMAVNQTKKRCFRSTPRRLPSIQENRAAVTLGDFQQALEAQRFAQVVGGAKGQRRVAHALVGRQDDDRDRRQLGDLLQLQAQPPAVHLRH